MLNSIMAVNTNFFFGLGWNFYQKRFQGSFSVGYEADFLWIKRYTVKIRKPSLFQGFSGIDDMVFSGLVIKSTVGF